MAISAEQIAELYRRRKETRAPELHQAQLISQAYANELVVPLAELDRSEMPAVANLIQQGIDQTAMRIASTLPDVSYLPLKPNVKSSEDRARMRSEANRGWWTSNQMGLKLRRRARWLIAYTSAPVMVRPDTKLRMPRWRNYSPLSTFAAPGSDPDEITPENCIFAASRTLGWLKANYLDAGLRLNVGPDRRDDCRIEVLEYVDDDEFVTIAVGKDVDDVQFPADHAGRTSLEVLERIPNRAGICPAVVPNRISLNRPIGQFDGAVGLYQQQAEFAALHKHAVRKSTFPEMWMVARTNETPAVVQMADPYDGVIGQVTGGDLKEIKLDPSFFGPNTEDRLAEAIRQSGGIPAEFSGQAATNVRTGKRAEQLISSVVDFPIQEAQELLARSMEAENQRAVAIDKAYWGSQKKSFYISWNSKSKRGDYTPNEIFEDDINIVSFPLGGADANGFTIRGGQKIGLGTMARRTFIDRDPDIGDPEAEWDRILYERFLEGVVVEFEQPQSMPLPIKAKVAKRILGNEAEVFDAIIEAQEEMQREQAEAGGGEPAAQPGMMSPEQAAQGAPQPPPQAPGLADLVGRLNL